MALPVNDHLAKMKEQLGPFFSASYKSLLPKNKRKPPKPIGNA
jgi:hypothetical protein